MTKAGPYEGTQRRVFTGVLAQVEAWPPPAPPSCAGPTCVRPLRMGDCVRIEQTQHPKVQITDGDGDRWIRTSYERYWHSECYAAQPKESEK